jgi:hypothetical protein
LVVDTRVTQTSGIAEPTVALAMAAENASQGWVTPGADQGYDQKELVRVVHECRVTPHVPQKVNSAIDRALATLAICSETEGYHQTENYRIKTAAAPSGDSLNVNPDGPDSLLKCS